MKRVMRRRLLREEKGFTLPEMMVTMLIMLMVLFALYNIFDMSLRVVRFANNKVEAVENARLGLAKMEREIEAAYPYDKSAATPDRHLFDTWTATGIRFGNDLDGNRKIECPNPVSECEIIAYDVYQPAGISTYALGRVNSTDGLRQPVVDFLDYRDSSNTGLRLEYYKADGVTEVIPGVGNEAEIAMVRLKLSVVTERGTQSEATQTLKTDVILRNRAG